MAKKTGSSGAGEFTAEVEGLAYALIGAAAERDLGAVYGAVPAAMLAELARSLGPEVEFSPPPSYQAFMAAFGSLRVLDAAGEVAGFCVYTPREAEARTRALRVGPEVRLAADDHLVAFADAGGGGQWCFDTRAPGPEYPVCCHRPEAPRPARERDGHEYADFAAWLRGEVGEFGARGAA